MVGWWLFGAAQTHASGCSPLGAGYLEEEAVRTYTHLIQDIDNGVVWKDTDAPKIGVQYWALPESSKMRELILAVRAGALGVVVVVAARARGRSWEGGG